MHVLKASLLPTETHEVEPTVEALGAALSQHYCAIGGPVGPKTLQNLQDGYYFKDSTNKNIVCTHDTNEEKIKITLEHCDEVGILNPLDVATEVQVVTNGTTMKIDSISQEFRNAGVNLPNLVVEWQGALFGTKKTVRTPEKRKVSVSSPTGQKIGADPNAFASKSTVMLSEALRKKMRKDEKSTSAASGSGSQSKAP